MKIIWQGQSYFQILTKKKKEGKVRIVIDPFDKKIGLRPPSLKADILLVSHEHEDHNNVGVIKGNPFLISGPGEYEVKGVFIQGIPAFHPVRNKDSRGGRGKKNKISNGVHDKSGGKERGKITIFTILTEGIKVCHLGDLGQKELSSEQLEQIGDVDILMIPVGGVYTISAKEAAKIISQLEPKIVIPMHYKIPKLKIKLEGLNKFLKIMGLKKPETLKNLSIKKKSLPAEEMKIVVLRP